MKRNNAFRWFLVVLIVSWALWEMYPPTPRPLIEHFENTAQNIDTNFNAIVERARKLEQERPTRTFANLRDAISTNDVTRYFPQFKVENERDPARAILHRVQRSAAGKIKLGLDLQGGTEFVMGVDTSTVAARSGETNDVPRVDNETLLEDAIEVLRKRVDRFGVAEPIIVPGGNNTIRIQLPGLSESSVEEAKTTLSKAAFLEFRLVHPENDRLLQQGLTPPGYEKLTEKRTRKGQESFVPYIVKKKAEAGLTGKYVSRAGVSRDPLSNQPHITLSFNNEGANKFADITRANTGRLLAIVLDGELYSAPRINEAITGGNATISGDFELREAFALANALMNPLETPVKLMEQRSVDPSLGADSIRSGIQASLIAALGTFAFMAVFYFLAGMVANFALVLNIIILMGVMCSIGSTLTLPGIAGIALTIGMAVDANVLIFERIREELAKGKGLRSALEAGYDRAFGTIFDSHVTTLITSIILIIMGSGPVQGFGVTLTIGVGASLFTALVVTRLVFDFMLTRGLIKTLAMMPILKVQNIDYLGKAKVAIALSLALIVGGMGYGLFVRGEKVLGVDFRGGDGLTMRFAQRVDVDKLREAVTKVGVGEPTIQYQRSVLDSRETLNVLTAYDAGPKVAEALKTQFPEAKLEVVATDKVGPSIGKAIQRVAIISVFFSLLGVLLYVAFRYEFGFAFAAVVATLHDVLLTLGVFFLFGGEMSATMVAGLLTIIGYSINDKIVILDRIREDLKLGVRGRFRDIINLALNQTLSRTLITGGSVILATLSLYLFGGGVIHDFAFTFLVGVLAGTYSSIFIASPFVLWWYKGERPALGAPVVMDQTAPARV